MAISNFKKIAVITANYPEIRFPEKGVFVERLVKQWRSKGIKVDVVAPISIPNILRSLKRKEHNKVFAGNRIERPIYMSFSNKKIANIDFKDISNYCFKKAVMNGIDKISTPDIFYGKFLKRGGYAALKAGIKFRLPVVADLGESRLLEQMDKKEKEIARENIPQFNGIVCVSKRLVKEVIELGAQPDHVLYAPNTVDTDRFYPMNKKKCRSILNLPQDEFIVVFVGHFIDRKGPLKVLEAINSLNGLVKGVFLGRGPNRPDSANVLHADAVPNKELPTWLNASDVFVLPTLAEGYSNAINEAIACGIPVISSDIPDIRPQVTEKMGLLIDPLDSKEIAKAIYTVYENDKLLEDFSKECIKEAKIRFKEDRASKILDWMEGILG